MLLNILKLCSKYLMTFLIVTLLLFYFQDVIAQQQDKFFSANRILSFTRVSQVLPSPSAKAVAYVSYAITPSAINKKWIYSLYLKNQFNQTKLLTQTNNIASIVFSPDGNNIFYLAPGKHYQSIWLVNIATQQRKIIFEFTQNINAFKLSPDGQSIAFLSTRANSDVQNHLINVSHEDSNSQLFILQPNQLRSVKPITLNNMNVTDFDWSPDNQSLAISFKSYDDPAYSNENHISIIDLKGNVTIIPYMKKHAGLQPHYSPNGKWLAFSTNLPPSNIAQPLNNDVDLNNQICVTNLPSLNTHCLTNTFNQNSSIIGWNATSDQVFVLDAFKTQGYHIYGLNLDASKPTTLISTSDGFIEPLTISLNQNHTMFGFGYETVSNAPEAYVSRINPFRLQRISHLNASKINILGKTQVIQWTSSDGMTIEGLLLTPNRYNPNKKYPLYVAIHGGPSGVWGKRYLGGCDEYGPMIDPTTCWQNLLDLGFIVFEPNPRGSTGYGLSFRLGNFADFGGADYRDIMTGVDDLIHKGIADPKHLAIGGWSFGGYMSTWIISQDHRFKAAIDGDGNTDFISFSGTSDIPDYYENYLGTPFWVNNQLYLERSPIMHVRNFQTPLLIIHGENDVRVPLSQSYQLYTALKRQHKPVKMIILPKQQHVPTEPNVIFEIINEVDVWLKHAI